MDRVKDILRRTKEVSTGAELFTDSIIGVFSPKSRLVRAHKRLMERDEDYLAARKLYWHMRGYEAAETPRNTTPWLNTSDRDADGELNPSLKGLRERSRAAEKDDATGSGIFATRRKKVIGKGLRLQVRLGKDDKERANNLEAVWKARQDKLFLGEGSLTQAQGQRMLFTRRDADGDVFLHQTSTNGEPVWFEVIEADRVDTPPSKSGDATVSAGVKKDPQGRVEGYYVNKRHPGASLGRGVSDDFTLVPADQIKHLRSKVVRPGQSRGLPLLHAVLQDIRDFDLLILASLKRTQVAACLALFIETDGTLADFLDTETEDYGYQLKAKLEPSQIFKLYPGEKVKDINPSMSVPKLNDFVWLLARRIGAAIEMSPHAVLNEWGQGISFSAARTIKIEDDEGYDIGRDDFSTDCLDWLARIVWADALLRGDPLMAGFTLAELETVPTEWIGDRRRWVDPLKEAQTVEKMLELGLTTKQIECARLGLDWEEVQDQRIAEELREREQREEAGLPEREVAEPSVIVDEPARVAA